MAIFPGKVSQIPRHTVSITAFGITAMCFVVMFTAAMGPYSPTRLLTWETASDAPVMSPSKCPIIVYNKQIKTGSTVVANVLYRSTEAYGCYNAGCKFHQLLMNGNASHVGATNGLTLTCHAQEKNTRIVPILRATHGKAFAYIASVREPLGWFKSTACFFYRQRVSRSLTLDDEGFKTVVDWLLQPSEFEPLEAYLFRSLGLYPNSSKREMLDKLLQYDLIIDNAKMQEGLDELGKLLRWKLLKPTQAKHVTYRGPLYDTYRADEIKERTKRIAMLYEAATEVREAKHLRPAFAKEEAPRVQPE